MKDSDISPAMLKAALLDKQQLSINIAHEWGHILYLEKLGIDPIYLSAWGNINGTFAQTGYFAAQISDEEGAVLTYCGPVAEGLYCGRRIPVSYTDAEKLRTLTKTQKARARKIATAFISPKMDAIKQLVDKTKEQAEFNKGEGPLDFTYLLKQNQISELLKEARKQVEI